jgi:hypothetical protein
MALGRKALLHLAGRLRRVMDADDIYYPRSWARWAS